MVPQLELVPLLELAPFMEPILLEELVPIVEPIPQFQQFQFWFFSKTVQFQFQFLQKRNHNNASVQVCLSLRDKFGRTPLMFAALADYPECAEALLKHGARPQLRDRSGRTAMHWAAHHGNINCLKTIYGKSKQVKI